LSKYIWLSSKRHSGSGPQLPNGELPLFVWKHPETSKIQEVYLIEGGLKSLLVAFWLWREGKKHIVVIGTASAARYGQQTLQDYLTRLGANRVKLLPDAGAIANRHINKANQQTLTWLQERGYHPLVADWGQLHDKSQPDFDELLAQNRGNEVRFISAGEYLERSSFENSEQQRLDEFEVCHGFTRWLKRLFDRHRPKKGFGLKPLQKPVEPATSYSLQAGEASLSLVMQWYCAKNHLQKRRSLAAVERSSNCRLAAHPRYISTRIG
jgi:hypothetical protein